MRYPGPALAYTAYGMRLKLASDMTDDEIRSYMAMYPADPATGVWQTIEAQEGPEFTQRAKDITARMRASAEEPSPRLPHTGPTPQAPPAAPPAAPHVAPHPPTAPHGPALPHGMGRFAPAVVGGLLGGAVGTAPLYNALQNNDRATVPMYAAPMGGAIAGVGLGELARRAYMHR